MSLNIKNEEVHRLVEELARKTGESQTQAVKHAVEEKLRQLESEKQRRFNQAMVIAKRIADNLDPEFKAMTHEQIDDLIYDEHGLPN